MSIAILLVYIASLVMLAFVFWSEWSSGRLHGYFVHASYNDRAPAVEPIQLRMCSRCSSSGWEIDVNLEVGVTVVR